MENSMNKKASLADAIYGPIYILVIGITMFLAVYLFTQTKNSFLDMPNTVAVNASITEMVNNITPVYGLFDYAIPFIVGALLVVSLIFAFKRGASVAYIGLAIVFWCFALLLTSIYTNIFTEFSSAFPSVTSSFPILIWVMDNIKWIVLAWLFLISVVMFSRSKKEEQQLGQSDQVFSYT